MPGRKHVKWSGEPEVTRSPIRANREIGRCEAYQRTKPLTKRPVSNTATIMARTPTTIRALFER